MMETADRLIAIRGGKVLLDSSGELPSPFGMDTQGETFRFGSCLAVTPSDDFTAPPSMVWTDIRASVATLGEQTWISVAKGAELLGWAAATRYCSRCGAPMKRESEISLKCSGCSSEVWPQLSPCIMVLVRRGREALLVHARSFTRPFFGLVAGFVETGERLEECVRREVAEETGLQITGIRYVGSQSWPFPAQLMIGFTANYAGGELAFADGELSDGGFFSPENMPPIPAPPSLARRMIDDWRREVSAIPAQV